jgi:hypothetical protein
MAPPLDFGAVWTPAGTHRRYGHDLPLWLCREPTPAWHDAYRALRGALVGAGYSWTDRGHSETRLIACWWNTGVTVNEVALSAEVDRVVAEAAAARDARARAEEERHARDIADTAPLAAPVRAALTALLAERPWAVARPPVCRAVSRERQGERHPRGRAPRPDAAGDVVCEGG